MFVCRRAAVGFLLTFVLLFATSCTSLRYAGVDRIARYDIPAPELPDSLDGYRVAFASDFHLPSKFRERQLAGTVRALGALKPDVILLGGDYQEDCEHVEPLFSALTTVMPQDGIIGVLGNNDFERCTDIILQSMQRNGIHSLDYDTLQLAPHLVVAGVPFCTHAPLVQPLLDKLDEEDFVILVTHSPDIVQTAPVTRGDVDIALAGHTHGGQVTLFYVIAPETASRYGRRFLYGKHNTTRGVPVITSRGLGTSRLPIRFCAPTDIVLLTLRTGRGR